MCRHMQPNLIEIVSVSYMTDDSTQGMSPTAKNLVPGDHPLLNTGEMTLHLGRRLQEKMLSGPIRMLHAPILSSFVLDTKSHRSFWSSNSRILAGRVRLLERSEGTD